MPLSLDEIQAIVDDLEKESKALKTELFRMAWFMRGGMTISEIYELDLSEREIVAKIIQENLETTKTSNMPFF